MKIPGQLVELVKKSESFARIVRRTPVVTAAPYVCPAGFWTIGYGVLCQPDHPEITLDQGEAMLMAVLPSYVAHAVRLSPGLLAAGDGPLTAISDFVFNLGPTRYAASTLRRRINEQNWSAARGEMSKWVWGGGRILPGLVLRRAAEAALL